MQALISLAHNRKRFAAVVLTLTAILFVAVNLTANIWLRSARVDLTENQLFTLSDGTINILNSIEEPITIRYFYSQSVATGFPQISTYSARVRDILAEYASRSNGKLIVEEIDPEPFSEEEDRAAALGIRAAPTQSGEVIYFGLVMTNTVDGKEVIDFLDPAAESRLEYDLSSRIATLNAQKRPLLGLVTNLPLDTGPGGLVAAMQGRSQPYVIYRVMQQFFDFQPLEQEFDRVPANIDTLMIAHPKPLSQRTLYAIDQFVMRGGKVILFLDPISEISQAAGDTGDPVQGATFSSDLQPLLGAWGVDYSPEEVVADRLRAQKVQFGSDLRRMVVDYVVWLGLTKDDFNANDIVTSSLTVLNLGTPGYFKPREGATTTFTPIITSSNEAMLVSAEQLRYMADPDALLRNFLPTGERYAIAARIAGPVKSAFNEAVPLPPTDGAGTNGPPPPPLPDYIAETANANIVVMADSDLFDDRFWTSGGQGNVTPTADNGAFVVSLIENMLGSSDLISLRARDTSSRPFTAVDDLRRAADARFLVEEQRLQDEIAATQQRIRELQAAAPANGDVALTPEQEAEMERFYQQLADTRLRLRDVQRTLHKDVDALGTTLAFVNIALVPLLLMAAAVVIGILRRRRRAARA